MAVKSSIVIHFDSLNWLLPKDRKMRCDPSFYCAFDRFFEIARKHSIKYTIFVIGSDLENPEFAERVKDWSMQGHEIANHSYSHKENLGSLDYNDLEIEVMKSHELIEKTCGRPPMGFTAPNWAASPSLIKILIKHRYRYDASVFPSYFMWPLLANVRWNTKSKTRKKILLQRKDWLANIFASRNPYLTRGSTLIKKASSGLMLVEFPIPTTPFLRIPCWHTMSFLTPDLLFSRVLNSCLKMKYFYYVLHPADIMVTNDIPKSTFPGEHIYRLEIPLQKKLQLIDDAVVKIKSRSAVLCPLKEIAEEIINTQVV